MSFPQTRRSLIVKLLESGSNKDWLAFLADYWHPVCHYVLYLGKVQCVGLHRQDAEDIASLTFQALVTRNLLDRWISAPSSKLRSLLCVVARRCFSNYRRLNMGRERSMREKGPAFATQPFCPILTQDDAFQPLDIFYISWVDELLERAANNLHDKYRRKGKGNHFPVLYGKICEQLNEEEIALLLDWTVDKVKHAFSDAKKRLGIELSNAVRESVRHYCNEEEVEDEFTDEWHKLSRYLKDQGGLNTALARSFLVAKDKPNMASPTFRAMLEKLTSLRRSDSP